MMTEPLDHDVTVAGPVTPELQVSTTGTDSDFVVKLIDVYPADYPGLTNPKACTWRLPAAGARRAIPRQIPEQHGKPEAFTPNQPAKIEYVMPDICHTFRPGHRIMVQIQSSWFPLMDLNPQKFLDIPNAKAHGLSESSRARLPRLRRCGSQLFLSNGKVRVFLTDGLDAAFETGDASRSPFSQRVDSAICCLIAQKGQVGILAAR